MSRHVTSTDPGEFKELVRSRTHLVDLISESLALKPLRAGADYIGLCPFHDDHNPSFHVYPDRQSWTCWVCQEYGDCFSFVMKKDGLGFRDALEFLARRANLEMPRQLRTESRERTESRMALHDLVGWAKSEFHGCLLREPVAQTARDYLSERGFTEETLRKFEVGYHPDDWHWLLNKARGRFDGADLVKARLAGQKEETQSRYDYFRDRVVFPIHDERGRPVAFGGRVLPGSNDSMGAKYWNSPESPFFSKSRLLYAFNLARDAIRKSGTAIVTEGYTDCMMAHQQGVENVVATLGVALTEHHVAALKRIARRVVLVFDGDPAGLMAAERSVVQFLAHEVDLRILRLPERMDLADFVHAHGAEELTTRAENAAEAWGFKLEAVVNRIGLRTIDARHQVLDESLDVLSQVPRLSGTARESMILAELARRLGLEERVVRRELANRRSRGGESRRFVNEPETARVTELRHAFLPKALQDDSADLVSLRLECELLQLVLTDPTWVSEIHRHLGVDDIRHPKLRQLLELCFDLEEEGLTPTCDRLMSHLANEELKSLLGWLDEEARRKELREHLQADWTAPASDASRVDSHAGPASAPGTTSNTEARDDLARSSTPSPPASAAFATDAEGQADDTLRATGSNPAPPLLTQLLDRFRWRRQQARQEQRRGELARQQFRTSDPAALTDETRRLLEEATAFHKQRASRDATGS